MNFPYVHKLAAYAHSAYSLFVLRPSAMKLDSAATFTQCNIWQFQAIPIDGFPAVFFPPTQHCQPIGNSATIFLNLWQGKLKVQTLIHTIYLFKPIIYYFIPYV